MNLAIVVLALVTLQRLFELWLSNRNTRRLLAQGAHEVGAAHYPLIVAVHLLWLAALWWLAPDRPVDGFWLAMFVLLELARIWVVASLGRRWTTRIIVLAEAPLVRRGPYRWVD
ncbi:MAG: isoprenylcysteine carboxylmethyltransferase family protein, partial [Sphingomicrobium sp.]